MRKDRDAVLPLLRIQSLSIEGEDPELSNSARQVPGGFEASYF